jgi:PAS domain S-box-containing protein
MRREKAQRRWSAESEPRYQAIFEAASEGIITTDSKTHAFVSANPAFCRMLGYTGEELLVMHVEDIHPTETLDRTVASLERLSSGETTLAPAVPCLRKDGRIVYADVTSARVTIDGRDYIVGFFSDVTERIQAEDELRTSERRYEELFDHMSSCVAVYEARGAGEDFVFVDFNKAAERADGIAREDVVGKSVLAVFPSVREFGLFDVFQRVWRTGTPERHPVAEYKDRRIHGWRENYVYRLPSGELVAVYDNVTARVQAEEALRRSEREYRLLVDNASEAIFIAQDGYVRFANRATEAMLERTREEMASTPFAEFIHSDDREFVVSRHKRRLAGEPVEIGYEFRFLTGTGDVRWGRLHAARVEWQGRPATLNLVSDVTKRRQAEQRLRESEELLRAVADNYPDSYVLIIERNLRVGLTSGQEFGKRGLDPSQYVGAILEELFGEDAAVIRDRCEKTFAGHEQEFELAAAGQHMLYRTVPIRQPDGSIPRILAVAQNITERREAERQRIELEVQLRQTQRLESIGTLASGVAHEINNPLMGVLNYAELLRPRTQKDPRAAELVRNILAEGTRIAGTVKNLLSFARHDEAARAPQNIREIVEASLSLLSTSLLKSQIKQHVDVPQDLPEIVCQRQQIQQVLVNLITNAQAALDERHPGDDPDKLLSIAVRVLREPETHWLRIAVEDHGTGIPEAMRRRIFDPFFTSRGRDRGTGLGLWISRGIVIEHGGRMTFETEEGKYTRFFVDLPMPRPSA